MENEKKDYNERKPFNKQQCFYFNDKGQLVVESNKGVWVDGEKFVKMYGDFVCNAKTMGEIIHQLKGIAVEVGVVEQTVYSPKEHLVYCVLGASQERIEEYEKELAKQCYVNEEIKELSKQFNDASDKELAEFHAIERFNRLPWWKRLFKKIEVK